MSDGAAGGAGGAPGGAAPAGEAGGAPATVAPIGKATPKAPPKKPDAPAEWSEKDDADLFERMKKAPWAKVRANGEDKHITNREEFLALTTDASRSRGMNKLAEQTKKEQAEAKAAKEEHAQHKVLLDRARRGDQRALRELGLVPDTERAELQQQWEAMSPEQQEVYRRNHELEQRLAEVEQREALTKKGQEAAAKQARQEKVLGEAREHAKSVLKDVKAEFYDVELPEIISAMHEMLKTSQRIGRDYTPEQLAAYVQQRREAGIGARVANLKPEAALKLALPHLKALIGTPEGLAQLEAVLGVDFEPIAGALSGRRLAKWKADQQKKALSGEVKKPDAREEQSTRSPLPIFRF